MSLGRQVYLPKGNCFCQKRSLTHFTLVQKEAQRLTFLLRVTTLITRLELSGQHCDCDFKHFIYLLSSLARIKYVTVFKITLFEDIKPSKASCFCHLVVSFRLPVRQRVLQGQLCKDWETVHRMAQALVLSSR